MSLPGGTAEKEGNRYENCWTVVCMIRVMKGEFDVIRIEPPGEEGQGIEFFIQKGSKREYHQVKRQQARQGSWSLADLEREKILRHFWDKLRGAPSTYCVFVSIQDAPELRNLCERAQRAKTSEEFRSKFLTAESWGQAFEKLCNYWGCKDPSEAFDALRRIRIETAAEKFVRDLSTESLRSLVTGNPDNARDVLAGLAQTNVNRELNADQIWEHLASRGLMRREPGTEAKPIALLKLCFAGGSAETVVALQSPDESLPSYIETGMQNVRRKYPMVSPLDEGNGLTVEVEWPSLDTGKMRVKGSQIQKHREKVSAYYENQTAYLRDLWNYENLKVALDIQVHNTGSSPANDVDVFLTFPRNVKVFTEAELPCRPSPPPPPERPQSPGEEDAREQVQRQPFFAQLRSREKSPESPPPVTQTKKTQIEHHFPFDKVKQNMTKSLEPRLYVMFDSFDSASSFEVSYRINADGFDSDGRLKVTVVKAQCVPR